MADVKVFKVASMPTTWVVNAVYWVKIGSQVSCYVTDSTGTPYLTTGYPTVAQNQVLAGPASGGNGIPGFRTLTAADLPAESDPIYTASIPNQLMYKADIPNAANLNTYTTTGIYHQNSNAQAETGSNYPIAVAGKLEVVTVYGFVYQEYHSYQAYEGEYFRSFFNGTWTAWSQRATKSDAFPNVIGCADMNTIPRHQATYVYDGTPNTPLAGHNYMALSIGLSTGEYPSAQMAWDVYPLANDVDGFYYRKNYENGFSSQSPWYQVASRSWANTSLIQNQFASAQNANAWISGYMKANIFVFADGSYLQAASGGNTYLLTAASDAQGLKVGSLVISNSYGTTSATNGLTVTGQSWLVGGTYTNTIYPYSGTNIILGATGNTITANAALYGVGGVYSNTINPYTGIVLTVGASGTQVKVPSLSSGGDKMVVATSTGQLTTQELPSNLTLDSAEFTPTITAGTASSYSPKGFRYMRIGNVVHVVGHIKISGIPTAGANSLRMILPVGSTIGDVEDVAGTVTGFGVIASTTTTNGNKVEGYVNATPQCSVSFMTFGTSADLYVTFSYAVH